MAHQLYGYNNPLCRHQYHHPEALEAATSHHLRYRYSHLCLHVRQRVTIQLRVLLLGNNPQHYDSVYPHSDCDNHCLNNFDQDHCNFQ